MNLEEYLKLNWMNVVPEIICDILGYLANYIHFRTDVVSREAYESLLQGQIRTMPVMTEL